MTAEGKQPLAPEIQALLESVASDPRSRMLRVPKLEVPLTFDPPVSPGSAFLNSAERHLLQVHRVELARILLAAAQQAIYDHPAASSYLHHSVTVNRELAIPKRDEWQRRGIEHLSYTPPNVRADDTYTLLERCVRAQPGEFVSAVELTVASLRLQPRAETRIWLALALHQCEQRVTALHLLHNVIAGGASHLNLSCAWESAGQFEWDLGHFKESVRAYREASSTLELRSVPAMSWFVLAMRLEDQTSALEAAGRLGDLVSDGHPSVDEFLRLNAVRRRNGSWTVSDASRRLSRSVENQLPSAARRIANAAFQ